MSEFDKLNGRFRGTVDEVDEDVFKFDRMVFALVCVRVDGGGMRVKDDGTVVKTMGLAVSDVVPLTGALRDQAIAYMAHGADQGILDFGNHIHHPDDGQLPVADYAAPPDGVDADGVLQPLDPDDGSDLAVIPPPVAPVPVETNGAGPPVVQPTGSRIGVLRGDRKDKALDAFLSGE